jgi:hypothetical protein
VARFAESNDIPMVKFKKGARKIEVMRPLLARAARSGRPGVVAIGWAQEFCHVWDARKRVTDPSRPPQFSFAMAERRVTCYYFYLWDEDFGPAFIKVCAYFPYSVKVYLLTELRRGSAWSGGRLEGWGSTVPARDRIRRGTDLAALVVPSRWTSGWQRDRYGGRAVTREVAAINVGQGRSARYRRTDLCQRKLSAQARAIGDDRVRR